MQVEDALAWATEQATTGKTAALKALTPAQATVVDAVAARIIPAVDGRPGAREAGVVYFVDRALATFNAEQKTLYADGVADLNRRAAAAHTGAASFAALTPAQQDALLHEIEQTPFFQTARFDTIVGTFGHPDWGGNRNHAGWRLLGFEHRPVFEPPFGFYDADVNRKPQSRGKA